MLDPIHLRTFVAVAQRQSFTRAAVDLGVSQPTCSRQVKALEEAIGQPLFEQLGRQLNLTATGAALFEQAPEVLGSLARLEEQVGELGAQGRRTLRLWTSSTPGRALLPEVVAGLNISHPHLSLELQVSNSQEVFEAVAQNAADLGFAGSASDRPELIHRAVAQEHIVCAASPGHALAGRTVKLRDLTGERWIRRKPGSATRALVDAWLDGAEPAQSLEVDDCELQRLIVGAGGGLGFVSSLTAAPDVAAGRLVLLDVTGLTLSRQLYAVHHKSKLLDPAIEAAMSLASLAPSESLFIPKQR